MPESFGLVFVIVLMALIFDFINGFHDTANAVATSIATGALSPRRAIIWASVLNFLGAVLFTGVAHTIGAEIADPAQLENGLPVIMAALMSAVTWNLFTWYLGIPSSSSHALIGSLAGAAAAAAGWETVNKAGLWHIIQALIISPLLAMATGFFIMSLCKRLIPPSSAAKADHYFRKLQVITAFFQAFSHGTNDAQKTMGVITFALVAAGLQPDCRTIPLWVKITAALAMAAGTSVGGWRIIYTVSQRITRLRPPNAFSADLSSAGIIITATLLHLPVSTTHVISSSVVGAGISGGVNAVNWQTVRSMICAWLVTLPVSFISGTIIYRLLSAFMEYI
ncbi:PiT family inorganic phosphate transporter [Desulfohalotomaculum tongense]|uniref:inorganic phosphate transporter n=1 Tax=Desulforadius tongensis TaxID=1216062 RepID=UPI00195ED9D2|nr:inorganic phosphate transporter [Desulforadius tongensis]MBM7855412.1 PiT family inorganic phosphate transporter [Desulforadius tongensis]